MKKVFGMISLSLFTGLAQAGGVVSTGYDLALREVPVMECLAQRKHFTEWEQHDQFYYLLERLQFINLYSYPTENAPERFVGVKMLVVASEATVGNFRISWEGPFAQSTAKRLQPQIYSGTVTGYIAYEKNNLRFDYEMKDLQHVIHGGSIRMESEFGPQDIPFSDCRRITPETPMENLKIRGKVHVSLKDFSRPFTAADIRQLEKDVHEISGKKKENNLSGIADSCFNDEQKCQDLRFFEVWVEPGQERAFCEKLLALKFVRGSRETVCKQVEYNTPILKR